MAQDSSSTSELTIDVTCTPRNRANLRRLKTGSIQSFQRWEKENELLYAMIDDESAWISSLFPDAFITPELFFYALEDGIILCQLANFIQEMADNYGTRTGKSVPGKKFTFHKSKKGIRQSKLFHSRENVDKFLTWCRWHGIPEAILFESNDAVLVDECRTGGREIVICLMEIARRSSQYEIEVPQMIKLEREIDEEELSDTRGRAEDQRGIPLETNNLDTETRGDRSPIDSDSGVESVFEEGDPSSPRLSEFVADETKSISKSTMKFEEEKKPQRDLPKEESHSLLESSQPKTELDRKVCKIAQEYNIKVVHRLKEGKYIILGKTMFVRMLNDHLLVRIGGGWDTLDHYVMTHAPKLTASEEITTPPSSSDRKSSGIWNKLVDRVKRRESQPNLTESPVVISKRERPDSSPSAYRLRDRVRKKLSITEKDEKDISDAIRKIESSLTVKSSHSPSFTSKTFFQLKNRFDKGRKSSRENIFNNKERKKMTDQTVETITGEQQKEAESKEEEIGTTQLREIESSNGATEELASSTTNVTEFSTNEFSYQKQSADSFPSTDDFLLFDQQAQQNSGQSFPSTDPDDLLSNDNPPFLSSEALHPEPARDEDQAETHKDEEEESRVEIPLISPDQEVVKSDSDFLAEIAQEIESKPTGISDEAKESQAPAPALVPDDDEPRSDFEEQPQNVNEESPADGQADVVKVAGESDLIKVSSESENLESAQQENDVPNLYQGVEQQQLSDHPQTSVEQTEAISDKTKQEENGQPTDIEFVPQENNLPQLYQGEQLQEVTDYPQISDEQTEEISDKTKQEENGQPTDIEFVSQENDLPQLYQGEQLQEVSDHPQTSDEQTEKISNTKTRQDEDGQPTDVEFVSQENDLPQLYQGEELQEVSDHPQTSVEQTEVISDTKTREDEDGMSTQLTSDNATLEMKVSREQEKLEGDQETQMIREDLQSSGMALKDIEYVSPDTDKEKDDEAQVSEIAQQDTMKFNEGEEPEYYESQVPGVDVMIPLQLDGDAVSKGQEKYEESEHPAEMRDEISQDASFEQEEFPGIVTVVESKTTVHEDKQPATSAYFGENVPKGESVVSPTGETTTIPFAEEQKVEQDKIEQKEAINIIPDTSSAPIVDQKTTTKKTSGTAKKENAKAANSTSSKNLTGRKKEDQKAERPTKSSSARTTKSTSTTTAPKTRTATVAAGARSTSATKRQASAQTQKTGIGASKSGATKTTSKTTPKLSESRRPPTTTTKPTTAKDKKPPTSGGNQMSKSVESRPRSAISTKSTDKKDGKAEAPSRPLGAKTKPSSGITKTAVKKTATTTTKTTSGPASKSEVVKTTTMTSGGRTTKTTVKKSTEPGGKTKTSKEGLPQQTSSVRNNTSEMKKGIHGKPGSASLKAKPAPSTTRGKPGSTMAKGKTTSERPKSPTKGTAKKSAPTKNETTISAPPTAATKPPAISSLNQEASDLTPDVIADSKESVTTTIQRTEVIKDDGETKVLQTLEITETVLENGEEQTVTKETVVEDSG